MEGLLLTWLPNLVYIIPDRKRNVKPGCQSRLFAVSADWINKLSAIINRLERLEVKYIREIMTKILQVSLLRKDCTVVYGDVHTSKGVIWQS